MGIDEGVRLLEAEIRKLPDFDMDWMVCGEGRYIRRADVLRVIRERLTMPRCSTCKHWRLLDDGQDWIPNADIVRPLDEDTYEPKAMPFEVRFCKSPKLHRLERPTSPDACGVVDGSMYRADFYSGPDFGCVNHESKETT